MKKTWFKMKIKYAQLKQWLLKKTKKIKDPQEDNIYPFM